MKKAGLALLSMALLLVAAASAEEAPPFDGELAMDHLRTQIRFGPRVPGTEAHANTLAWMTALLETLAPRVTERRFRAQCELNGESVEGVNLIASFRVEEKERIFIGAHWDSRAYADLDPDESKRKEPVPGANDGASGVGVLLALADLLSKNPPPVGVDLLFFDVEDQGIPGDSMGYCVGSRLIAASSSLTGFTPRYGIVIDMVGDEDLLFYREKNSVLHAPLLVEKVFRIGGRIAPERFADTGMISLYDDHVPFLQAGIPVIVLAGFGYPEWHTTSDLPGICSARALEDVGKVLAELIWGDHEIP